jgi:hypothetical protein
MLFVTHAFRASQFQIAYRHPLRVGAPAKPGGTI